MILDECDSTNAELRRRLESGLIPPSLAHGYWISARRQTSGRGRQGRTWISNEGGLYFSLLLQTETLENATWIPLMASVSVTTLLNEMKPSSRVEIKWPNDIFVKGVKAGGILVEGLGSKSEKFSFILGIGLNVESSPEDIDQPTTFVKKYLPRFDLEAFLPELVKRLLEDFSKLSSEKLPNVRERFIENSYFQPGARVSWSSSGETPEEGMVLGLGDQGQLLVQTENGEKKSLYAADVKVRASKS